MKRAAVGQKHPRIKIQDLPKNLEVSKEEMQRATGGALLSLSYQPISYVRLPSLGTGTVFQSGGGCGCGCG